MHTLHRRLLIWTSPTDPRNIQGRYYKIELVSSHFSDFEIDHHVYDNNYVPHYHNPMLKIEGDDFSMCPFSRLQEYSSNTSIWSLGCGRNKRFFIFKDTRKRGPKTMYFHVITVFCGISSGHPLDQGPFLPKNHTQRETGLCFLCILIGGRQKGFALIPKK